MNGKAPNRSAGNDGFTLIEILAVLAIIGLLLALVMPRYVGGVDKAREAVLRENLRTVRESLDKYYGDTGVYPVSLGQLVDRRYLRDVPQDPVTGRSDSWILVAPRDQTQQGVFDVRSGAQGKAADGSLYKDW